MLQCQECRKTFQGVEQCPTCGSRKLSARRGGRWTLGGILLLLMMVPVVGYMALIALFILGGGR